jgi:hypothetical protein
MAGFHKFNREFQTSNLNPFVSWFKMLVGAAGAVGTVSQAKANLVESITRNSAGVYTVQLTRPYPYGVLACIPQVNRAAPGDTNVTANYDAASYSNTAGTLVIHCTNTTGVAAATDPPTNSELHVMLVCFGRKGTAD